MNQDSNLTPIELELSHLETVHVTMGSQKIASLSLVLKDSPEVDVLINHPFPVSKMIITDVIPVKNDPTKADVIFRNLSNEEVIEMSGQFLLPKGTLMEVFGEILGQLNVDKDEELELADGKGEILIDDDTEVILDYDDEEEGPKSVNLTELLAQTTLPLPAENKTLYSIRMTLAQAHLGQMICVGTNAPAFVLTSETLMKENKGDVQVWEDFIALLEFPYTDTAEYFDATASLIQAVTGTFPLNLAGAQLDFLRASLINSVLRLSEGSQDALIKGFGLINNLKKFNRKVKLNRATDKPTPEDSELYIIRESIDKMYHITSPQTVAALIQETPNTEEYIEDIDTVNEIFKNSGLQEIFEDVLENEKGDINFLTNPTDKATKEELIAYYSAPLTPVSFPEKMRPLVSKIEMPLLYENNWISGLSSDALQTEDNSGEITVAKLITVAVRFSRLKTIIDTVPSKLNPIGFLIQAINLPGESPTWSYVESTALLSEPDDESLLFDELVASSLPRVSGTELAPEEILQNVSTLLLHSLGHSVMEEGWDQQILEASFKNKPLISGFLNDIFNAVKDEASAQPICPVMIATLSLFALRPDYKQLVHELGKALKFVAELNALKNTDYASGSKEFKDYTSQYLREIFSPDSHNGH